MKLSLEFPELAAQRERIGAEWTTWTIHGGGIDPRPQLLADLIDGIQVELGEVQAGPGKLLTYQGEQVILYIKDTRSSLWTLQNAPEDSRRFHIADCQTLEEMRRKGKFEKYVVTRSTNGLFLADWLDPVTGERGTTKAALKVCKHCLSALNWRGYSNPRDRLMLADGLFQTRPAIWEQFSISEFLMEYSTFFRSRPSRRDTTAPLNVYVDDWPRISEARRRAAGWRCEQCGVTLSSQPSLLHCHHRSGVVTDNSNSNLAVLCALCHASQPDHEHMSVPASHRTQINRLRIAQGIRPK